MDQQPGSPYLRLHVRELERYRLVVGQRLAKRGPLGDVARRVAERRLGDADGLRGYPDPAAVQVPKATRRPLPSSPSLSSSGTNTLSSRTSSVVAEITPIFVA